MDDFLVNVSFILNISQNELEQNYYMVDLPLIIEKKRKQDVINRLSDIYMILATNNRSLEESEYKDYIQGLNKSLDLKIEEKFSRTKFEQLRMMTQMGANKAR